MTELMQAPQGAAEFIERQIFSAGVQADKAEGSAGTLSSFAMGGISAGTIGVAKLVGVEIPSISSSPEDLIITGYGGAAALFIAENRKNSKAERYTQRAKMLEGHKQFAEEEAYFRAEEYTVAADDGSDSETETIYVPAQEATVSENEDEVAEEQKTDTSSIFDRVKARYREAKKALIVAGINTIAAGAFGTLSLDKIAESNNKNLIGSAENIATAKPGIVLGIAALCFSGVTVQQFLSSRRKRSEAFDLETQAILEQYHQLRKEEATASAV